jgi:hypothetical protein
MDAAAQHRIVQNGVSIFLSLDEPASVLIRLLTVCGAAKVIFPRWEKVKRLPEIAKDFPRERAEFTCVVAAGVKKRKDILWIFALTGAYPFGRAAQVIEHRIMVHGELFLPRRHIWPQPDPWITVFCE